ncbi:DUF350 domain-containing protein [Nocardioides zeae]|uniref:Uncharacterized membrane protein YjfL (UPF0719 family) n=2 Tax=Nocardioides zeae TaxID=1457234 RepID=A0ACC6IJ98_9ACTN|nr:DUF350 domain-containing protein [Nocardioides zeae]MDR6174633.1 uncharacterized membrane protein YjfL (UPF0719 family) [Nocardioides zeae]MDR6210703.1 uncharacterized membrane protein YjfL (UPF0719 family) [Nocardioides zeae]NEN79179.1 DUF350 domain-containing protein [Nocardioides zeae]
MPELLDESLATLAFAGVGIVLLLVGYFMVDLLTPGHLGRQVFVEHKRDAALVLASTQISVGIIVATAFYTAQGDTWDTLLEATVFGIIGVALLGISFFLLDLLTPGSLAELVVDESDDPAVYVAVALQLAVGLVVAASIT